MRYWKLLLFCAALAASPLLSARPLVVVSSIKPLQLLVTAVGGEEVDSRLLLAPGFSPHDARLKPSQWQMITKADLVVWIGPELEQFLVSALQGRDQVLRLGMVAGEELQQDPHIWLGVDYIADMATRVARELAQRRPRREAYFLSNAAGLVSSLRQEAVILHQHFAANQPRYLLQHQGYRYFERQLGLQATAVISPNAEQLPGTAHVTALRERLQRGEFDCVFTEPQHESKLVRRLLDGVMVKQIILDPMGSGIENTMGGFLQYYQGLADAFRQCRPYR